MPARVDIRDCSKQFLEGMAKSLARTIDNGITHNADGDDLRELLERVFEQIKVAPGYFLEHNSDRR